jgi:CheY-like chemotaxis protein
MRASLGLKILVVEDDADTRDLLVEFLSRYGYGTTGVPTATEGLKWLQTREFHLVISDHSLVNGPTGAWMLNEAATAGLLQNVGALMYTADPKPEQPPNVRVLQKPTDLADLLQAVEEALASAREKELERVRDQLRHLPGESTRAAAAPKLELVLYVTDSSSSLRAVRNLEAILRDYDPRDVQLRLCDLSKQPTAPECEDDRIVFTPTLVKRRPEPRERLMGDMEDPRPVEEMLRSCRIERKK